MSSFEEAVAPLGEPRKQPRAFPVVARAETVAELSCQPVGEISPLSTERRWLIEDLWVQEGAGLIGGPPKAGKSWLMLDLALSVASGTQALGRFAVSEPGPVIVFPAEDRAAAVRERVDSLARARGVEVTTSLPLHIITAESLRLDEDKDREALELLLARISPKLLILDPLVRLHSGSENSAEHVAELLGYLRRLQRRFSLAIMVTHHVSKRGGHHPGDALRGSTDLHAWGDSNLYLQRSKELAAGAVRLTIEHRFASAPEPCVLRLLSEPGSARFELLPEKPAEAAEEGERERPAPTREPAAPRRGPRELPLRDRVLALLQRRSDPLSQRALRVVLHVRNADLTAALRELEASSRVENLGRMGGWRTITPPAEAQPQEA